jgi:thioesterase domain-containing protein
VKSEDVSGTMELSGNVADRVTALSPEKLRLLAREIKKKKAALALPALSSRFMSQLVTIRASGSNPPLFLVHPVGGGVMAYHDLARYLSNEQPVYALQNHDGNGREDCLTSIEAMAARYVQAVVGVYPSGPYLLGGSSMGGVVAFEMALQLVAGGRQVPLVVMLDSPARMEPHEPGITNELLCMAEIIAASSSQKLLFRRSEFEHLPSAEQVSYVFHRLQEQGLIPASVELSAFHSATETFTGNLNALEKYVPRSYAGRVAILRATEMSQDMKAATGELWADPSFGWQAFCARPVGVHSVPGNHIAMNLEPHVQVVGSTLQQCINQALSEEEAV